MIRPFDAVRVWHTSRTTPTSGRWKNIEVRPAATNHEVQALTGLLAREETSSNYVPLPEVLPHEHHAIHPVLVGAWHDGDLVGAAWAGSSEQEADWARGLGFNDDADVIRQHVAMVHSIAVERGARRHGVALALKDWLGAWARKHDAHVILSCLTNDQARSLNQKAGHVVLDPGVSLVMQVKTSQRTYQFPIDEGTAWAMRLLRQASHAAVRVGVLEPGTTTNRQGQHVHVRFLS